jgi:hypothetical protein
MAGWAFFRFIGKLRLAAGAQRNTLILGNSLTGLASFKSFVLAQQADRSKAPILIPA